MQFYSEPLQKFRLAGQGLYDGPQPNNPVDRERLVKYFDPLPMWYEPLEQQRVDKDEYPFFALTQRPMFMYHSWDSQNVWLRQIMAQNYMYMNARKAAEMGIKDFDWIWVESHNGKIRCQVKTMEGTQEDTVWTWNAIGKQKGAWGLKEDASEATKGFLLNHLISELLPEKAGRAPRHQLRPGHRPGGVVRPAREDLEGRAGRDRLVAAVRRAEVAAGRRALRAPRGAALRRAQPRKELTQT